MVLSLVNRLTRWSITRNIPTSCHILTLWIDAHGTIFSPIVNKTEILADPLYVVASGGSNSPKKIKPSALGDCATIRIDEHHFPEPAIAVKVEAVSTLSKTFEVGITGAGSAKRETICEDTARDRPLTSEADGERPSWTTLPERYGEVKPAPRNKPFHGASGRTPERPPKETRSPRACQQKASERISFHHVRSPRSPESGKTTKGQARPTIETTEEQPEVGASKTRPDGEVEESSTECRKGPDRDIVVEAYPDRCLPSDGDTADRLANDTCPPAGRMGAKAFENTIVSRGGRKGTASAMVVKDKKKGKSRTLRSPHRVVRSPKCLRSAANAKRLSGANETVGKDVETQESTGSVAKGSLQSPDVLEQVAKDGCGRVEFGVNQTSGATRPACNNTLFSLDETEAEEEARDKDLETRGTIYGEEGSALSVEKAADPSSTRNDERGTVGSAGDLELGSAGRGKAEASCNDTTELKLRTSALQETNGSSCILCQNYGLDALRAKVNELHSEKVELEDTLAQLNVAAAQLYLVEYEQMKVRLVLEAPHSSAWRVKNMHFLAQALRIGIRGLEDLNYQDFVCVCVFIKLHITAQSGPVILVILCHSH